MATARQRSAKLWVVNRYLLICFLLLSMMTCSRPDEESQPPEPGVSWTLAQERAKRISHVAYDISFSIPEDLEKPVTGEEAVSFTLSDTSTQLVLDFQQPPENVLEVRTNQGSAKWSHSPDHLVISPETLVVGRNEIKIKFRAGDSPLNRHSDYLYSLFVPNRASAAFPCFDQPDLKARYHLGLQIPASWTAVANGAVASEEVKGDHRFVRFTETKPVSTYLFSFAAGDFKVEESEWKGTRIRLFHRETDRQRAEQNLPAIFDLHCKALGWLESYTGIDYPFEKFDFVAVPAFQFSGMEHPGAILYRDSSLFLDESPTQTEVLQRASLIAHETAHMWFGDLVTMRWFDDVWTKEVFANFIAAKIVNPSFPEIDHQLRFFLAHYPSAYDVDRTEGTHAIRQPLQNMKEAGSLYGAIIYQKAPIMMRQLEMLIGENTMRAGLQEYLKTFSFSNATWPQLVDILDKPTESDLRIWSSNWVEQPARPWIKAQVEFHGSRVRALTFHQQDPLGRGVVWPQRITPLVSSEGKLKTFELILSGKSAVTNPDEGLSRPDIVLPDGRGVGYGFFELDESSRRYLLENFHRLPEAVSRATAWTTLYDAMLEGHVRPHRLVQSGLRGLKAEREELNVTFFINSLAGIYWGFLSDSERQSLAPQFERQLWDLLQTARSSSLKSVSLKGLMRIAVTDQGINKLRDLWEERVKVEGLHVSEQDYMRLAWELAVRGIDDAQHVLNRQSQRIKNPDRGREFVFVVQAFSPDPDNFFHTLRRKENRKSEPWVLQALGYLHHPLRAGKSVKYIKPSLDMLEEIQATGDIFFAKGWLDATLSGHSSPGAAKIVRDFLEAHPSYPPRLKAKILQSADLLFRKAKIRANGTDTD